MQVGERYFRNHHVMKYLSLTLYLPLFLLLQACATVPAPIPIIPQRDRLAFISGAVFNDAANLNLGYVTKNRNVLNASFQRSFQSSAWAYDLGIGGISPNRVFLGMLTYGYEKQTYFPISNGLSGNIYAKRGGIQRLSMYIIATIIKPLSYHLRISKYNGDMDYWVVGYSPYTHQPFNAPVSCITVEQSLFITGKHVFAGMGLGLNKDLTDNHEKNIFDPWPLWITLGYQFQIKIH